MTEELIRAVTLAETPAQMVTAVKNLAAAKDPAAISTLIAVFGYNNPTAAVVAADGLTELGEIAVPQLLDQIDDYNYGARAYSIRTLAAIADPRAIDVLITVAATDFSPSVRRAAAKGLGNLHWHKLDFPENLTAINRALDTLLFISQDTDWSIRYAAVVGLQALAKIAEVRQSIMTRLQEMLATDVEKAVRARVQLAYSQ
ncbi:HEAT repeat domain-containing protein [Anabaena cylindrica FACHB-243]|uniref:PBS lyase HEAT domain protein repeat-containing protein n=1 Tax=Anabaena cylindrica (strain ATCC 27899 / PCC 7122) TaxID=272123 RepID=K9ZF66_ANACC|nr:MULTISPECIES: HEAT repeat domain-containing protein [Anabaena]AFZ57389.1 PBS lyase HEAT domain protein repeat-containing protein [Anabaena cylindrica PCC 7122]MBD2421071.1 HEAT repeat domain-containing protein [Anabaena cylindrica FACHB-243]MBY5284955.1 HEAT repeat domain-containing protein [Anabaena sp. CCAP 1446/1C]MBY5306359.1 HEAT repeat domain-containing protein [Anabaena sp. CCAP 1446/1C]MCM2405824.1 HEAT repeat domain-containing protein [Anabaena sp. CCAP 1446/1C]